MDENYTEVYVDDYDETSNEQPIIYTRDIKTCIAALVHLNYSTVLLHILATKEEIELDNYKAVIGEVSGEIESIELFTGPYTEKKHIQQLIDIASEYNLNVEVIPCKTDIYGSGSIGYNQNNHCYYNVIMESGKPLFNSYDVHRSR